MATIHKFPNAPARAPARPAPAAPVTFAPSHHRPTLGERLVLFFRLNGEVISFWFGIAAVAIALGVVIGAYVARML